MADVVGHRATSNAALHRAPTAVAMMASIAWVVTARDVAANTTVGSEPGVPSLRGSPTGWCYPDFVDRSA